VVPNDRRTRLRHDLLLRGFVSVEVGSEFEAKGLRSLARMIGKKHRIRVHSHLGPRESDTEWPRTLHLWNPDQEVTQADLRQAANAMDALFGRVLRHPR
jgi:hypothetical protein